MFVRRTQTRSTANGERYYSFRLVPSALASANVCISRCAPGAGAGGA